MEPFKMSDLRHILINNRLVGTYALEGCSDKQIEQVKQQQGVDDLPRVYVEFLKQVGCCGGHLFSRGIYCYPLLGKLKENASDRIEHDFDMFIGKTNFVFVSFDNDIVYWFDTKDKHDDPPIYTWIWHNKQVIQAYASFTALIISAIDCEISER